MSIIITRYTTQRKHPNRAARFPPCILHPCAQRQPPAPAPAHPSGSFPAHSQVIPETSQVHGVTESQGGVSGSLTNQTVTHSCLDSLPTEGQAQARHRGDLAQEPLTKGSIAQWLVPGSAVQMPGFSKNPSLGASWWQWYLVSGNNESRAISSVKAGFLPEASALPSAEGEGAGRSFPQRTARPGQQV